MTFVPDGYVGTVDALKIVLETAWPDECQRIDADWRQAHPENYEQHCAGYEVRKPPDIEPRVTDLLTRAERHLRNMLYQGKLKAVYFVGRSFLGRGTIPAEYWASAAADETLFRGDYAPFGPVERSGLVPPGRFVRAFILEDELRRALASINAGTGTAGAEKRCQAWLEKHMRDSPQDQGPAKDVWENRAKAEFPGLSGRAFERAWGAAISETGASGWGRPGPKSTQKPTQ